jgi:hypothetical protein
MTADEAFDFGLAKIDELRHENGLKIKVIPYDFTRDHAKKYLEEPVEKHQASTDRWCRINFKNPMTDEQHEKVRELGNYLNMVGMSWDSGGCAEGRDWEWDWSFKYVAKDNQEAREARDQLEDLFKEVGY